MVAVGARQGQGGLPEAAPGATHRESASLLRDVLFVVFKRKVPLFTLVLLGVAIVLYGSVKGELEYEALARVFVKRQPLGYQMPAESDAVLRRVEVVTSEIQIATSAAVAAAVVDRLGLAQGGGRDIAIHRLQKRIKAESPAESDIIDIKYRDTDPEMAAAVVNAALDAYLDTRRSVAYNREAVDFLNHQAAVVRAEMDSIANEIARYGGTHWQLQVGRRSEQQMVLSDQLQKDLVTYDTMISSRKAQVALLKAWLETGQDLSYVPSADLYDMPTVQRAKSTLLEVQQTLATARSRYAPEHPEVLRLEREVGECGELLRDEVVQGIARMTQEIREWEAERNARLEKFAALEAENPQIAQDAVRMRILEHEMSIRADLYAVIMDRREQYRITAATDPRLLQVGIVSRATVPAEPAAQAVNMRVVVGLFTIFFGVMLVLALERMEHSLERPEDVERMLGVKVLAWIPERGA